MSQTPTKLGKYDIVRAIGNGAMGVVYEGFDSIIERTVAIKTIRKEELDPEDAEEHSRRFLIEAKAAGKLNHPNIVGIYDYGDEQGLAYIVMEFVQGKELKSYFDAKYNFNLGQTQRLMTELLEALGYSHHRGVIHRDVKPANLFVTEGGMVKLGDFGIARIDSSQKTHAGTVLGTPSYMSPEQIRGEVVDARSDLYSAGVILYQFLVGERPFSGNMVAIMQKVLAEPPPPPSSKNPAISPALDALVAKALAKSADDRFQNAAEFASGLALAIKASAEDIDDESTVVMSPKKVRPQSLAADSTGSVGITSASLNDAGTSPSIRTNATGTGTGASKGTVGNSSIDNLRRQAEDAKRRAEEEMRQLEEQLRQAHAEEEQAQRAAAEQFQQISTRADASLAALDTLSEQSIGLVGDVLLAQGPGLQQALAQHQQVLSQERQALNQWLASGPRLTAELAPTTQTLAERLSEAEQAARDVLDKLQASIKAQEQAVQAEQARLRLEAEQRAAQERERQEALAREQLEAERLAEEKRLKEEEDAKQRAMQARLQREAEQRAAEQKAAEQKAAEQRAKEEEHLRQAKEQQEAEERKQRQAQAEQARLQQEAEQKEAARQEAARKAAEQKAAEQKQAEETERLEAKRRADEERQRQEALAQEAKEKQRQAAEKRAEEEKEKQHQAAIKREAEAKQRQDTEQRAAELKQQEATLKMAPLLEADQTVIKTPAPAPAAPPKPSAQAQAPAAVPPVVATVSSRSSNAWMAPAGLGVVVLAGAAGWFTRAPEPAPLANPPAEASPKPEIPTPATETPSTAPVPDESQVTAPTPTPAPIQPPEKPLNKPLDKAKEKDKEKAPDKPAKPAPATPVVTSPVPAQPPAIVVTPAKPVVAPPATVVPVQPTPKVTTLTPADTGGKTDKAATPAELYREGQALIREGRGKEGVRLLEQAGNAGNAAASKRLMELYSGAESGVAQDYGKAVKWKNKAKSQGVDVNE